MTSTFSDLGVDADLCASLATRNVITPFPVQAMALPPALAGRDVCGRAPTGSGKTLAFGIPLAQRVTRAKPGRPRGLVLAPTRELAAQIEQELRLILGPRRRSVAAFYGGVGFGPQLKALRRGVDVAVACPGRLEDLIARRELSLADTEIAVVDEADRMADMGFLPAVRRILDAVRADRQTLLFSATLDGDVDILIRRYQHDPVRCEIVVEEEDAGRTTHEFVNTSRQARVGLAADLVSAHGSTIVFCRTQHGVDRVAKALSQVGVSATAIHGGRTQAQRDRALAAFSGGRVKALVATDVAARGIHVDDVGCVVHFDLPGDHKDYVHRSGRTGRAGAEGRVVTFVTEGEGPAARKLQRALNMPASPGGADEGPSTRSSSRRAPAGRPQARPAPRPGAARRPAGDGHGGGPASGRPAAGGNSSTGYRGERDAEGRPPRSRPRRRRNAA